MFDIFNYVPLIFVVILFVMFAASAVRILPEYERGVLFDVPPQDVITHDNVTVKVSAVIYFRVMAPDKAIIEVENFLYATSQLSQTTLRSVLGQVELDELLANREKI